MRFESSVEILTNAIAGWRKAVAEKDAEIERLRDENAKLREWLPNPLDMSGWADDGVAPEVAIGLVELAQLRGINVPEKLREQALAGGEE
jgi:hypothetical protein